MLNTEWLFPLVALEAAAAIIQVALTGRVTPLGCWSHSRRYFVKAVGAGERDAEPYLRAIKRLFCLKRLARRFQLTPRNRQRLRQNHSQLGVAVATPPKTGSLKITSDRPSQATCLILKTAVRR